MPRPKCCCKIKFKPLANYFKPYGVPIKLLEIVELTAEEVEALRLKNIKGLEQEEAAKEMGISQSSFQRILSSACKKTSEALIMGKAIKIARKG